MGIQPNRGRGTGRRPIEKNDIIVAQSQTRSAAEAARYLRVNYVTYKRYAQMYGMFEQHKNTSGKGINKRKYEGKFGLDEILANQHPTYDRTKLKRRLIQAGLLKEECALCKFAERRLMDGQVPLVLHTLDAPDDLRLKNLRVLCFNCFSGEEQYITPDGLRSFAETVGTSQVVRTIDGSWKSATIEKFGHQPLQRVELKPVPIGGKSRTSMRRYITCTPTHRWITSNRGEVTNLTIGDVIPFTEVHTPIEFNREAWIRGFGFGDGSIGSYGRAQVRLCGEKDRVHLHHFEEYGHASISYPPSANGDPFIMFHVGHFTNWKTIPEASSAEYLTNWLDGYIAADGHVRPDGTIELSSQSQEAMEFVSNIAPIAGYHVTGRIVYKNMHTNLGMRKHSLQRILLKKLGAFRVVSIEDAGCSDVYCAVEPITGTFTLASGALTGNCTFLTTGKLSKKLLDGRSDYKFAPGVHDADLTKQTSESDLAQMMRDIRNEFAED